MKLRLDLALGIFALASCGGPESSSVVPSVTEAVATSAPTATGAPVASVTGPQATDGPGPAAWVAAGTLQLPRISTRAVPIAGGRILVAGNDNTCAPGGAFDTSTATEVGRLADGGWVRVEPLPRPREDFVLMPLPDGSAIAVGGITNELESGGFQSFRRAVRFDVDSLSWRRTGDLQWPRLAPLAAVLADGRVLVAGGWYIDDPSDISRVLDSAEIYDPATATWTETGSMSTPRGGLVTGPHLHDGDDGLAVALADGRVLVAGGDAAFPAELYDPASGQWAAVAGPGMEIGGLVALRDGGALAVGGMLFSFESVASTGRTSRFDPATLTWQEAAPMPGQFTDRTFVTLADGRVLAAGGALERQGVEPGRPAFVKRAEIYDPMADGWEETVPLPERRSGAAAVRLEDGSVLLVGGATGSWSPGAPSCPDSSSTAVRYIPGA